MAEIPAKHYSSPCGLDWFIGRAIGKAFAVDVIVRQTGEVMHSVLVTVPELRAMLPPSFSWRKMYVGNRISITF